MIRDEVDTMPGVVNGGPPASLRNLKYQGDVEYYSLSPDRRSVAFTTVFRGTGRRDREIRLYVALLPTRRVRLLDTVLDEIGAAELVGWSPDSHRVLFFRCYYGGSSMNADGVSLYDVAADGGAPRRLTTALWKYGDRILRHRLGFIVFSPDGKRLLLVQGGSRFEVENKRLVCRDYATNRLLWMTEPGVAAIQPVWSPDGKRIAYIACPDATRFHSTEGDTHSHREAQQHLFVRDADGKNVRQLTRNPKFREEKPQWQSNGLLRSVRLENADLGATVGYRTRLSLWETHGTGGGMRKLRDLPPDPPKD